MSVYFNEKHRVIKQAVASHGSRDCGGKENSLNDQWVDICSASFACINSLYVQLWSSWAVNLLTVFPYKREPSCA